LKGQGETGATGPTGPMRFSAVPDSKGEHSFLVTGPTGSAGQIKTVEATDEEVVRLLKPLLLALDEAKSKHYWVQRAKATIVLTKGAKAKGRLSLGIFGVGGEGNYEKTRGIEIEIERIKDSQ